MDHEDHLTVATEKFRNEMAELITYVQRAEKQKDSIATTVTANKKITTLGEIIFSIEQMARDDANKASNEVAFIVRAMP